MVFVGGLGEGYRAFCPLTNSGTFKNCVGSYAMHLEWNTIPPDVTGMYHFFLDFEELQKGTELRRFSVQIHRACYV